MPVPSNASGPQGMVNSSPSQVVAGKAHCQAFRGMEQAGHHLTEVCKVLSPHGGREPREPAEDGMGPAGGMGGLNPDWGLFRGCSGEALVLSTD